MLRKGKAKKNDPPIPMDWAPISGSGKRVRREENDEPVRLEPIRFRYSTESVVEEPEVVEENAEEKARRSRRPRKPRPEVQAEKPAPKAEAPRKQPRPEAEAAAESQESGEKKASRRPPYRRHRRPKAGGEG